MKEGYMEPQLRVKAKRGCSKSRNPYGRCYVRRER